MSLVASVIDVRQCLGAICRQFDETYETLIGDLSREGLVVTEMTDGIFFKVMDGLKDLRIYEFFIQLPNQVSIIPSGVFCLLNLREVIIAGVTFIPEEIKHLANLRSLDLSDGTINIFPRNWVSYLI